MDILTKVQLDHKHIDNLLQEVIGNIKERNDVHTNKNHILLENLCEEIKEHVQAEKACISEMLLQMDGGDQLSSQTDKENACKALVYKIEDDVNSISFRDEDLENKLNHLKKLLQIHSQYIEDIIIQIINQGISNQKSEELSVKFEQEKINTLISSIAYA